ncbi:C25 family cysteine peptidase [Candidatus Kryptobacter tengchongensis]|uniref:Peptidase family C25 n=1 Tax=Kryptobacter tengchongensis TaxID=1643429 RepID=A0A656D8B3_KRYT1|nr:C25 family cysteine peptidase [Candidatus Kryptobacter tengchongensis]CUT01226.1 Peptidase family C25 [Candidatus Kryptobacter tengchongensis]
MKIKRFLAFFLFFCNITYGQEFFNLIDHGFTKEIVIKIEKPEIKEIEIAGQRYSIITLKNYENVSLLPNLIPYYNFFLSATPDAKIEILNYDFDEIELDSPLPEIKEKSLPDEVEFEETFSIDERIYNFTYLGKLRGVDVFNFLVFPFKVEGRKLKFLKEAKFLLSSFGAVSKIEEAKIFSTPKINGFNINFNFQQSGQEFEYKIFVKKDGVYKITYEDLKKSGIDLKGVQASKLRVKNNGVEIPIYVYSGGDGVFNEGDYIEFYAERRKNNFYGGREDLYNDPFTDVNVYFLEVGDKDGLRLAEETGVRFFENYIDLRGTSFYSTIHFEEDVIFERLKESDVDLTYDVRDHWFWAEVRADKQVDFNVYIPTPDPLSLDNVKMKVAFHGITSTPSLNPEHIAHVFVNNLRILTTQWNGQSLNIASSEGLGYSVPNVVLKNGINKVSVFNASDGRVVNTIFDVNWFEITYRRLYQADKDEIKFKIPPEYTSGYFRFELFGFKNPNISIYRIGTSKISNVEVIKARDEKIGENYHAIFYLNVLSQDAEFIAVGESAKLKPDSIAKDLKTNLKNIANSFDYLIITHPLLYDKSKDVNDAEHPLNKIKNLYESKGLSVKIISVDDIYDEFNHGIKSPYAIKEFLRYSYFNWSKAPTYILFAGSAVYDNRHYPNFDMIPTMFYQSYRYGATSADAWFTFIDGEDYLGDVILGRLPVRDRDELKNAVDKIISFWNQKPQNWNRNVLMIAGVEREFESQTDYLVMNVLPKYLNINRLYVLGGSIFSGGTSKLLNYFSDGQVLVNFVGHGGGAIWSDNGLLKNEDISKMSNKDKYPFITSMTCFSGAFDYPQKIALGVNLVIEKEKGAIGVLASSGLGWLLNDYFMVLSIFPYIFDPNRSIGEIITLGKAKYYSNYFFWPQAKTMVYQYNLIGDPAIKLPFPENKTSVHAERKVVSFADSVKIQIQSQIQSGFALITISDSIHVSKGEFSISIQSGRGSFSFKPSVNSGFIKVFVNDGQKMEAGFNLFKIGGAFVGDYSLAPENPKHGDSLSLSGRVELENQKQPDSVKFIVYKYKSKYGRFDFLLGRDTLLCASDGTGFYASLKKVPVIAGTKYLFQMVAYSEGKILSGEWKEIIVGGLPDPSLIPPQLAQLQSSIYIKSPNLKFTVDSIVKVSTRIYNLGDVVANDFKLKIYYSFRDESYLIGLKRFSVGGNSSIDVEIPLERNLDIGTHRIYAVIEGDSLSGDDIDYSNNIVYSDLVYNFVKFNSDSISVTENISLKRNSQLTSLVVFEYPATVQFSYATSNLYPIKPSGEQKVFMAKYDAINSNGDVEIFVRVDLSDPNLNQNKERIKLYLYDEKLRIFKMKNGVVNGEWFHGRLDESGVYTLGFSNDSKAPRVEVTVEGQSFRDGAHVSANPVFNILIEDDEGVDVSRESLKFKIDGKDVNYSDIVIPDTIPNPKSLFVKLSPKLTEGEHWGSFAVRDVNGNWSDEVKVSFKVVLNFDVKIYGNFPNPFSDRTFFAYEIFGSPVEEVEFKIYTVAGRLIRNFKFPSSEPVEVYGFQVGGTGIPTSIGYHEIWWDGTDRDGNEVANGVYFYKFSVKRGGKVQNFTGKIARVR